MNVSSISNNSNAIYQPHGKNNVISILEKQKMYLQDQIQKINESKKMDEKTKQDKVKSIRDQIDQINLEIQEKRSEKLNQNQNTTQENKSSQSNTDDNQDGSNTGNMPQLVQASATYSQAKVIHKTKNNLNGKGNVLKIEIKLDGGRGGNIKGKTEELHDIENREKTLDKKIGKTLRNTQKQIKEASKTEVEKNSNGEEINNTSDSDNKKNAVVDNKDANSNAQVTKRIHKNYKKIDVIV